MRSRLYTIFTAFILFSNFSLSPLYAESKTIQIKGSDTMVNLGQSWAEEFMAKHSDVSIAVTGGGSGTGIAAILSGTCDIAQSSRDLSAEEKSKAAAAGHAIEETQVAYDGIAILVHPSNPVEHLTTDQLADIFSGKVTNWKEVGGKDAQILVLSRERNSGTHIFFLEHIVRRGNAKGPEEFSSAALMMPSSQAIVQEVETSENGIGYVGLGYVTENLKVIPIGKTAQGPFVAPTPQAVQDGSYPIGRALLFLTRGKPEGAIKSFIDFALSPEGQEIVGALDFVPNKS